MRKSIVFIMLGTLAFAAGCNQSSTRVSGAPMLCIYYFPIGAQTLTPVTIENIESRGKVLNLFGEKDAEAIKKILQSADRKPHAGSSFSDKLVRVKIFEKEDKGERLIAVIDNDGVIREGNADGFLSQADMKKLKTAIENKFQ